MKQAQTGQARESKESQREKEEAEPILEAADIVPEEDIRVV
jgi:hypothetical protein